MGSRRTCPAAGPTDAAGEDEDAEDHDDGERDGEGERQQEHHSAGVEVAHAYGRREEQQGRQRGRVRLLFP